MLNVNNQKYRFLYGYRYGHDDNNFGSPMFVGKKHDYEEHILKVCPELSAFADNKVPNTYLKKIYYELNELSNNELIRKR